MDLQISNQVAVVAAASKGLGKAAALAMAQEGARLAICSRSEALEGAADEIRAATGAEVLAVRADVTVRDEVEAFVKQSADHYGQIDILIANCGGGPPGIQRASSSQLLDGHPRHRGMIKLGQAPR